MKGEETLKDRSFKNYKVAQRNFEMRLEDDYFLNVAGYYMQQSAELYLKHYLEINGINYPKTHDLMSLINLLPENSITIPNNFLLFAGTITTWEARTRYIKNFYLAEKELILGFRILQELFDKNESDKSDQDNSNDNCKSMDSFE